MLSFIIQGGRVASAEGEGEAMQVKEMLIGIYHL